MTLYKIRPPPIPQYSTTPSDLVAVLVLVWAIS